MFWKETGRKEKVLAASLPPPQFLFHYKSHHFFSSLSLSQALVWCAEMHWEPCDANKAKVARIYWETASQTGTCVLVSLPLCQPPNWEQLAQRLFYMAGHDRLQLFHCSCFVNGVIWMKLWLELSFTTRHSGVSACQKDTSWKRPENRRRSRRGHCHPTSRRAVLLHVSHDRAGAAAAAATTSLSFLSALAPRK